MTISTEVRRAGPFTGTGLVATYAFAFKIFATSDVVATQTDLTGTETTLVLNTDYTVSMNADQDNDPGGDVVLTANLTSGYLLTITSDVPELQSVELTNLGGFYPAVLNPLFDKLVILCQQISEKLGRQITLPVSSAYTDITIPDPQANYYLQWKEDLSGLKNVAVISPGALSVTPFIETLLNDADAATARTTLGGVATLTGIETLTNKTLTTPTLTTPTLTSPVLNGTLSGTAFLDEDAMTSNSAIATVSQQSVKAYVDGRTALRLVILDTPELLVNGSSITATWTTHSSATLAAVSAKAAILRFRASANETAGTSVISYGYLRKTGTALANNESTQVVAATDVSVTSGNISCAAVAEATVNLDTNFDFDWYASLVGDTAASHITLVGYYL